VGFTVRLPRLYAKKRGHRRTVSREWGVLGDGIFHAILLASGLFFGGLLVSGVVAPEWRINNEYVRTTCTILSKGVARITRRNPSAGVVTRWEPRLLVRYVTDGVARESWARITVHDRSVDRGIAFDRLSRWKLGGEVPGWFDPGAPDNVVLQRGYSGWLWLLVLLLPGALVLIGGTGLVRRLRAWGKSEERLAASAGLSELLDPLAHPVQAAPGHPGVPQWDDLVNSPGTILRYRLPVESPEYWTVFGFGFFALLWNLVVVILAVGPGLDLLSGRFSWWVVALLVPFLVVGVGGVVLFVRSLLLATAIGTTQVEISAHPLLPGGRYEVLLAQGGTAVLRTLELLLELEEQATFRQGTDTRSEQITVYRQPVASFDDVRPEPTSRFETRTVVEIPSYAMHSFTAAHNAVRWRLVVRGIPYRRPAFSRAFPVVVLPPSAVQGSADEPASPAGNGIATGREAP
jgi:hypothetical protein